LRKKLLIVDDRVGMRVALGHALNDRYEVFTAADHGDAIALLAAVRPDAVLLDLMLGDEDGLDVLRSIKATAPGVPVIAVTVVTDTRMIIRALAEGCADYVEKPFEIGTLRERIEDLVA
jgi:two-component system, OmpR family, response regulator MprA